MPIQFVPTPGAFEPAATVWVHCPHHPRQVLGAWAMGTDGRTWLEDSTRVAQEYIGPDYIPVGEPFGDVFTRPVAEAAPGQEPHFRSVLTCPQPSCRYHHKMAEASVEAVHEKLREMLAQGQVEHRLRGLDTFIAERRRLNG